ncbi:hypothetical protein H3146_23450, partial [Streptomyces sp. OF3]|nr:hypothetical protein [Streptomyces alkaliterrae]
VLLVGGLAAALTILLTAAFVATRGDGGAIKASERPTTPASVPAPEDPPESAPESVPATGGTLTTTSSPTPAESPTATPGDTPTPDDSAAPTPSSTPPAAQVAAGPDPVALSDQLVSSLAAQSDMHAGVHRRANRDAAEIQRKAHQGDTAEAAAKARELQASLNDAQQKGRWSGDPNVTRLLQQLASAG